MRPGFWRRMQERAQLLLQCMPALRAAASLSSDSSPCCSPCCCLRQGLLCNACMHANACMRIQARQLLPAQAAWRGSAWSRWRKCAWSCACCQSSQPPSSSGPSTRRRAPYPLALPHVFHAHPHVPPCLRRTPEEWDLPGMSSNSVSANPAVACMTPEPTEQGPCLLGVCHVACLSGLSTLTASGD